MDTGLGASQQGKGTRGLTDELASPGSWWLSRTGAVRRPYLEARPHNGGRARGWVACAGGCLACVPLACLLPGILPRDRGFRQSRKPRTLDRLLFCPAFPSRDPPESVEPVYV